jgi:hypothetical protein
MDFIFRDVTAYCELSPGFDSRRERERTYVFPRDVFPPRRHGIIDHVTTSVRGDRKTRNASPHDRLTFASRFVPLRSQA